MTHIGVSEDAIRAERQRQDAKWGGPEHDDHHSGLDWRSFIASHAEAGHLLEVAALGFAVADALTRCQERRGHVYGVSELARALGVSEDVIRKRNQRGTLPEPAEKLTMGYVWQGEAIETYISEQKGETR
jgi:hypothetical protein